MNYTIKSLFSAVWVKNAVLFTMQFCQIPQGQNLQ